MRRRSPLCRLMLLFAITIFRCLWWIADAKAYAAALNGDKEKAVARCKVLIALRDSDGMASFLDGDTVSFEVVTAELK